jgi:hypothetical protein
MTKTEAHSKLLELVAPLKVNDVPFVGWAFVSERGTVFGYIRILNAPSADLYRTDDALNTLNALYGTPVILLNFDPLSIDHVAAIMREMPWLKEFVEAGGVA